MQSPTFHVTLRMHCKSFEQAIWQAPCEGDYADYLHFYQLASQSTEGSQAWRYGWLEQDGQRCWVQAFLPTTETASGTWLHLHGYYDHGASYPALQRWALAQNLVYVTLDLPGHGLSSGRRAAIRDFADYQQWLQSLVVQLQKADMPRPWVLSGFSTGGAITLDYLLSGERAFNRYALMAPLIRPVGWDAVSPWLLPLSWLISSVPRKFRENTHHEGHLHFVHHQDPMQSQRLPLMWARALKRWIRSIEKRSPCQESALILQGSEDTTVDWQHNLAKLRQLLPQAKTHILTGARHQLLNESPAYQQQVLDQLAQWLKGDA